MFLVNSSDIPNLLIHFDKIYSWFVMKMSLYFYIGLFKLTILKVSQVSQMDCRLLKQCSWTYSSQSNQTEPGKDGAPPVDTQIDRLFAMLLTSIIFSRLNIFHANIIY